MYTKVCGDVLINSSQDELLNDATQTPEPWIAFGWPGNLLPLCTYRKRNYVINITINAPNASYV